VGKRRPLSIRWAEKVEKSDDGCWLWTASTVGHMGYGHIWTGSTNETAHRVAWRLYYGSIPDGALVLHKCDVPACVNPEHLYLGDHSQNMRDKKERGREARLSGERNGRALISRGRGLPSRARPAWAAPDQRERPAGGRGPGARPAIKEDCMSETTFSIDGKTWAEVFKALKPHISRDSTRPLLEHVYIRFDGKRVAFEATDAYTMVRAIASIEEGMEGESAPFEVVLPAKHLLNLKPGVDRVRITRLDGEKAEVVCGVVTLALESWGLDGVGWPTLDSMIDKTEAGKSFRNPTAPVEMAAGMMLNPGLLQRLASLPDGPTHVRFASPLRPFFFTANGAATYEGLVMPIRIMDDQFAVHEDWVQPAPAKAKRKKAA
jgi:hypothetical protein